jgi:hypothetical protein
MERRLSILQGCRNEGDPAYVNWSFVESHEKQAIINHHLTLKELDQRGGVSPMELRCIVHDIRWVNHPVGWTEKNSMEWLREITKGQK